MQSSSWRSQHLMVLCSVCSPSGETFLTAAQTFSCLFLSLKSHSDKGLVDQAALLPASGMQGSQNDRVHCCVGA